MNTNYSIPFVIEQEGRTERSMDIYSRLLKDRIIWVTGQVEPGMANLIKAQIQFLEAEDSEADIRMYIDSPGGQVDTGLGIYDFMQLSPCDIQTVCVGQAASMGSLILMGGTAGKRFATPHARIMIHQPSGGAQGKASDVEIAYKELQRCKEELTQIYVQHTGHGYDTLLTDMDRDHYMSAEEAMEYGLIDKVLTVEEVRKMREEALKG